VRAYARARPAFAVIALVAGTVLWAALPTSGARPGSRLVLIVASLCGALTVARLLTDPAAAGARGRRTGPDAGFGRRLRAGVRGLPWAEGTTVAVLGLEALHPSRPWHTVVLGVALIGFLLALHLAETDARPAVLRPQLPLLAAGLGLAVLSVGAAALPAAGPGSGWLAVIAAVAALLAAGLALPV
jgi:hypothetical protein